MRAQLQILISVAVIVACAAGAAGQSSPYTFRKGDPSGTGKWYMDREIAHVMGYHGMDWLERPERQKEERVDKLLRNLDLQPGHVVVDVGAGSGFHSFRIAALVGDGAVYAVDIQDEMLAVLRQRAVDDTVANVFPVKGTLTGFALPGRPAPLADKVLMVDVYHEFSHPVEMMQAVHACLKPDGLLYLIEFRMESEWVPIKKVHKMSEAQAVKEMEAAGFELVKNMGNLPWQHCLVFRKRL